MNVPLDRRHARSVTLRPAWMSIACAMGLGALQACAPAGTPSAMDPEGPSGPPLGHAPDRFVDDLSAPLQPSLQLSALQGAQACGACHAEHYENWKSSPHGLAMRDPVFLALIERQREQLGTGYDAACTQCHSAIGTRSHDIKPGFDVADLHPITREGVTCEGCHRVTELARSHSSGHRIDPAAPIQGPFDDAIAPHDTARSTLLTSSDFCGGCHNVMTPGGLALERPLDEWKSSPAESQGKTCQTCHMPASRGRVSVLPGTPERDLHRHAFTSVQPSLALYEEGGDDRVIEALEKDSRQLLQQCADLKLETRVEDHGDVQLTVAIESLVSGHDFPTGSSFNRQFWLAVEVRDPRGDVVFASGVVQSDEDLADEYERSATQRDAQLVRLGATLRTASGEPTLFPWEADRIEHNVLHAGETRSFEYRFRLPDGAESEWTATVELRFRGFSPRLLNALGLDALIPSVQNVTIAAGMLHVGATGLAEESARP